MSMNVHSVFSIVIVIITFPLSPYILESLIVPILWFMVVIVSFVGFQKNSGIYSSSIDIRKQMSPLMFIVSIRVSIPFGSVNVSIIPSSSVSFA